MEKRSHSDIQNYLLRQNGLPQMKSSQKIEAKVQLAVDFAGEETGSL
jgi:hypothetical protein